MAQAIYKVWLVKPTEAWYQLSQEEQDKLFAQVAERAPRWAAQLLSPVNLAGLQSSGLSGALTNSPITRPIENSRTS